MKIRFALTDAFTDRMIGGKAGRDSGRPGGLSETLLQATARVPDGLAQPGQEHHRDDRNAHGRTCRACGVLPGLAAGFDTRFRPCMLSAESYVRVDLH